jgi:hypothetical protein
MQTSSYILRNVRLLCLSALFSETSIVPSRNVRILRGFGKAEEIIGHCHESQEAVKTRNMKLSGAGGSV